MNETPPTPLFEQVPDAAVPERMPDQWGAYGDDFVLGGEAAVPPGDYGPPIPSRMPAPPKPTFRELERRFRSSLTPAFPLDLRRKLPGERLWKTYRALALRNRSLEVDDYGLDESYRQRAEPMLDFLFQRWLRIELRHAERLPSHGGAILVCNHSGSLPYDATMLMHGVRTQVHGREVRALLEDSVFHVPFLGVFLRRIGAVRACQSNAQRLLSDGWLVAVFPEGQRGTRKSSSERHKLERFGRGGFVKLALRTGCPILPVAIVGPGESALRKSLPLPKRWSVAGPGLIPRPAPWIIEIGEPVDLSAEFSADSIEDRVIIAEQASRIRSQIQEIINKNK